MCHHDGGVHTSRAPPVGGPHGLLNSSTSHDVSIRTPSPLFVALPIRGISGAPEGVLKRVY